MTKTSSHTPTSVKLDRAAGALVGMAAGDALGAPYEFGPPLADDHVLAMTGGKGWEAGEWTDDTSMAIPIAQAAAAGKRLDDPAVLAEILVAWKGWSADAKDVGIQTQHLLGALADPTEENARAGARRLHEQTGRSGGNGSLMRTAPVALAYLDDEPGLVAAARRISDLTHFDPDAGDACVLWCLAIRRAVLTGEYDLRGGLAALPEDRRARWLALIEEAEQKQPRDFPKNGWVVQALQGAWSAIVHSESCVDAIERAVRGGKDTDTVAAIAGSLAGAKWGASAIPFRWKRFLHGWPGLRARELSDLAILTVRGGTADGQGWPSGARMEPTSTDTLVQHPLDDGVWLGSLAALDRLPPEIDAVVSLCRVGTDQARVAPENHAEIWLVDKDDPAHNPNLDVVLQDAVDAISALRAEDKTVFVHCVEGRSRTPSIGALYGSATSGIPATEVLEKVRAALPHIAQARFLEDFVCQHPQA